MLKNLFGLPGIEDSEQDPYNDHHHMYDVAVIGLGIYGACTLAALASRGINAVGVDQGPTPNPLGSSHGSSRIIRETTLESNTYAEIASEALKLWREADQHLGGGLLKQTGLAVIAEPGTNVQQHHGVSEIVRRAQQVASSNRVQHEMLSGKDLMMRYPALRVGAEASVFY